MNVHRFVVRACGGFVLATALLLTSSACAAPRGRIYVRVAPPVPGVEVVAVAPGPGYVWTPGYYRWDGRAYVWIPGRHVRPPRPRAVWVPGHWVRERRGYYWIEGRWR